MAPTPYLMRACLLACRQSIRPATIPRTQPTAWQVQQPQRSFASTPQRSERIKSKEEELDDAMQQEEEVVKMPKLEAEVLKNTDSESMAFLDHMAKSNNANTLDEYFANELGKSAEAKEDRSIEEDLKSIDLGERPQKSSLWYDDEDPYTNTDEDAFNEDDITSMAHGKLQEVKEMRHYARLAVWEMPLLSKLAKPFEPPTEKQVLRWRYTDYLGDNHPSDRKVVVQFAPDDLKLTPTQTMKLKKLAGTRYNPSTELIKMSSDAFQHAAQNKAYLSNLVDDLITAAKDPKDTFEDVPLDTRHHVVKKKPKFPQEWLMTENRRRALEGAWEKAMIEDAKKFEAGELVDGGQAIEKFLQEKTQEEMRKQLEQQREAAMVTAVPSGGGRGRARR